MNTNTSDVSLAKVCYNRLRADFQSPLWEQSLFKGIPNTPEYHQMVDCLKALGIQVRKRYRGPRRKVNGCTTRVGRSVCLKADATSFTVYIRRNSSVNAWCYQPQNER